jgi:hypothetical protein
MQIRKVTSAKIFLIPKIPSRLKISLGPLEFACRHRELNNRRRTDFNIGKILPESKSADYAMSADLSNCGLAGWQEDSLVRSSTTRR